jgi:three-Cys-motif partner protein
MSDRSKIEWTDATWNPVRGCTKISPGCAHCYAETFAERFRGVPGHPYEQGFDLRLVPEKLLDPLRLTRPRMIFVNSMSDLFHKDVPSRYVATVAEMMRIANWHTYQVLTKRSERLAEMLRSDLRKLAEDPHIWWGVSVENRRHGLPRIEHLRDTPAAVKFLSVEPLLEDLGAIDLSGISWVIVGGESGHGARPMRAEWVRSLRDQCLDAGVPFFFKQWGGVRKGDAGRELDGRTYDAMPASSRNPIESPRRRTKYIREFESRLSETFARTEGPPVIRSLQKFGSSWTEDKLERVRKYLVAYSKIMKKRPYPYGYIDGSAGTGYRELRGEGGAAEAGLFPDAEEPEVAGFLDGSARIALQVDPRFHKYIFIEKSAKKAAELEKLKAEFPDKAGDILIERADANTYLKAMCGRDWKKRRGVLFIDPFGMQLTWDTLEAIGRTKAIDTWVLFPIGAVNRDLVRTGNIPESWRRRLDAMFGESDWYDVFFPKEKAGLPFGEDLGLRRKIGDMGLIGKYFNQRLESAFAKVAPNPYTLENSTGSPLFLLCFAAANPNAADTAIRIAQDILKRGPAAPAMLPMTE